MANDALNPELDPTYEQIQSLKQFAQEKLQAISVKKNTLRNALNSLNNIQYLPRTVEVSPMVPAVVDGSGTVTTPEVPAVTQQVYDVLPDKINCPDRFMTQEEIQESYQFWGNTVPNIIV